MVTYVILSRFSPEAFREPHEFKKVAEAVSAKIKSECSGIRWKESYAILGRFDVVDVVEANDPMQMFARQILRLANTPAANVAQYQSELSKVMQRIDVQ